MSQMPINRTARWLTYILLVLTGVGAAYAQPGQWITSDGDLTSTLINQVYSDSRGMVWISTECGLNRFDGAKIVKYNNLGDDGDGLTSDFVNGVFEDDVHRLYVCTHQGVQLYDYATNRFTAPLEVRGGPSGTSITDIVRDHQGRLYAVGNQVYDLVWGDDGTAWLSYKPTPEGLRFVWRALCDTDGNVWMACSHGGLYRMDRRGGFTCYFDAGDAPIVTELALDSRGRLYVGTDSRGLYAYDGAADRFDWMDLGPRYRDVPIMCMLMVNDRDMLLGTDGRGLVVYKPLTGVVDNFTFPRMDTDRLKVHAIDRDAFGNLWVGLYQRGVVKYQPPSAFFGKLGQESFEHNLIGTCSVTSVLQSPDGMLYVATDNDGLYEVDMARNTSRHYTEGLPRSIINLYLDSRGRLWVGAHDQCAGIFDMRTHVYRPLNVSDNGVPVKRVYGFLELDDGDMLLATMGNGLMRYNPATRASARVDIPGLGEWVTTIKRSARDGSYYVGTYDGFYVVSPDMTEATRVGDPSIIMAIHEEPKYDHIWLGTNDGLVQVGPDMAVKRVYTVADGLPSLCIYAVEHGVDALWLSTNCGLTKFTVSDGTFRNYDKDNGLPNNEFSKNASFKDADGNIYFGGIHGVVYFNASDVEAPGSRLTLRITDLLVGNRNIYAGDLSGRHPVYEVPIDEATHFRLAYHDNSFALRICTREYIWGTQTRMFYAVDDGEWTPMPDDPNIFGASTLMFNDVPSGTHQLRVKVIDGGVESDILSVTIDIDPEWYATWWATLLYIVVGGLVLALIGLQIYNRNKARRRKAEQQHEAEVLESKLQFFTDISHEIRTPLSLVMSPLQGLINEDTDPRRGRSYRVIMRNANRILRLVNEVLDLGKIDNRVMTLRYTRVNLTEMVRGITDAFASVMYNHGKRVSCVSDGCDDLEVWLDRSNFDKVLMNLLSNATKYTPAGGDITVTISRGEDAGVVGPLARYAQITVTDTGIGVSDDQKPMLFERFYQARNGQAGGTGIGLHLTRHLVELHHGTITVADNPRGQGTCFTVRIPLGCEHLRPDEICADDSNRPTMTLDQVRQAVSLYDDSEPVADEPAEGAGGRARGLVYVVEDDKEIRDYITEALSTRFRVVAYPDGKEALSAVLARCPDLVITDLMMPNMDGLALTHKIRQNINVNHVPVIMLTAKTDIDSNIEALDSGVNLFMTKPFDIEVLIKAAQNQIEGINQLRNVFAGNQNHDDKIEEIEVKSSDTKLMERVMRVVNKHLGNADITVEMIAQEVGISRVHLHRKLKELTNQSTRDFVRNVRLQAAAKLLTEKKLSVQEVSDLVGFKQSNNFSTCFKEMYGMSPTAYVRSKSDTPR